MSVLASQCAHMDTDLAIGAAPSNVRKSSIKNSETVRMDTSMRYRILNLLLHIKEREPKGGQQMSAAHYTAKDFQELGAGVQTTPAQVKGVIVRHLRSKHPKIQNAQSMDEGVAKYQHLIRQVPNAECSCCNQVWFPASISSANDSTLAKVPDRLKGLLKRNVVIWITP